eukprot:TRINITY_DN2351_c0_g2_i5.p1 TRINITY_DN2351_c0_g2~~TRINITY_DN2351_c0_g2_i5.p1  ORF type:complete len:753 (+),score=146.13 TRINITY_DN2351_c0_g2_i5:159-2417(+)
MGGADESKPVPGLSRRSISATRTQQQPRTTRKRALSAIQNNTTDNDQSTGQHHPDTGEVDGDADPSINPTRNNKRARTTLNNNNNNHHNSNNHSHNNHTSSTRPSHHEDNFSEEDLSACVHPLASHPDVPPFSDLQHCISQAILLYGRGSACSFEDILYFVSKKWRTLRRKDGSHYTTKCVRAIQANLRTNPTGVSLFKRDPHQDGYWLLCTSYDDALAQGGASMKKEEEESPDISPRNIRNTKASIPSSPHSAPQSPGGSTSSSPKIRQEDDFQSSTKSKKDTDESKTTVTRLTALQENISRAIFEAGGSCHFDFIVDTVSKIWPKIKAADGLPRSAHARKTVSAVLSRDRESDPKAFFMKDLAAESSGYWKLSPINPFTNMDHVQNEDGEKDSTTAPTALQELIIEAIARQNGGADFDQIYEHVSKHWSNLRRRDGTPYTADCRRVTESSLNSSVLFTKNASQLWVLTPKSIALRQQKQVKIEPNDEEKPVLSNVQQLIVDAILKHGGSASYDTIFAEATQRWSTLRRRDGSAYVADPKRSIDASLTKPARSGSVFEQHPTRDGVWQLSDKVAAFFSSSKPTKSKAAVEEEEEQHTAKGDPMTITEPLASIAAITANTKQPESKEDMEEESESDDEHNNKSEEDADSDGVEDSIQSMLPGVSLTPLQALAIRVITKNGGSCPFSTILEAVTERMETDKRIAAFVRQSKHKMEAEVLMTVGDGQQPLFKKDPARHECWVIAHDKVAAALSH